MMGLMVLWFFAKMLFFEFIDFFASLKKEALYLYQV